MFCQHFLSGGKATPTEIFQLRPRFPCRYYAPLVVTKHFRSLTGFPLGLSPLVVATPPRVPPRFPFQNVLGRQVGGERALQRVRVAAHGVRRVAVIGTLTVEAHVLVGRNEERLQQVGRRHLGHQLGRDVHQPAAGGHGSPETQ